MTTRNGISNSTPPRAPDAVPFAGRRLLTVKEVAEALHMSTRWVHERTRRREIPCYRFGSVLRFDADEVWAWRAQWRQAPEVPGT